MDLKCWIMTITTIPPASRRLSLAYLVHVLTLSTINTNLIRIDLYYWDGKPATQPNDVDEGTH